MLLTCYEDYESHACKVLDHLRHLGIPEGIITVYQPNTGARMHVNWWFWQLWCEKLYGAALAICKSNLAMARHFDVAYGKVSLAQCMHLIIAHDAS